jgi:hypothetical protein
MNRPEIIKRKYYRPKRELGQSIVIVALGMVALIAFIGLATDAALIYRTKQDLQRAIDSAALAAAYKYKSNNTSVATQAAYEFTNLHGYKFDPNSADPTKRLTVTFPVYNPPRKAVRVLGQTPSSLFFLRILGVQTIMVNAAGEAESAPLDVYLILDLSESMVYDTTKPNPWPPAGFTTCNTWDSNNMYDCIAHYCNHYRVCDPLDKHLKPAAKFFVDQFDPQFDRVGVVAYNINGLQIIPLSSNFTAVKTAIDNLDAFDHQGGSDATCPIYNSSGHHCNKNTNMGDGIIFAHEAIASEGRIDAIWSMVLETDGKANVYRNCVGCPPSCGTCTTLYSCDECQLATDWAINNAKDTWTRHETTIYTIAYGDTFTTNPQYKQLLIDIADWTDNGVKNNTTENFWFAPDEPGLRTALDEIAQKIYARLIK